MHVKFSMCIVIYGWQCIIILKTHSIFYERNTLSNLRQIAIIYGKSLV